jgi:hypothetical protein
MASRLFGYYATALNNGAAAMELQPTFYRPAATALLLDNIPFLKSDPYALSYDQSWRIFLMRYGDIVDYGAGLGVLLWFGLGLLLGSMARGFREGRIWATVLYPVWYIGIIEMLRIFYWGDGRFKVPLIAGPILVFYLGRRLLQRRSAAGVPDWRDGFSPALRAAHRLP